MDAAVAEGRQEMHSEDPASSEWATGVRFMRSWTGELFPARERLGPCHLEEADSPADLRAPGLPPHGWGRIAARTWRVERLVTEGAALFEHGEWLAARERFQAALKLAPGSAEVLSDLAASEEKLGDTRAAEEHYREAVRRQPESAEHLYNLGALSGSRQSYDEAYRSFPGLSRRILNGPMLMVSLPRSHAEARDMFAKARMFLEVALRLDPERQALHRRFGELELNAGNPRAALPHLEEARPPVSAG